MKTLLPRLFALTLGLFLLAGCMSGPKVNSIAIQVIDIAPGPGAGEISVSVRYVNENVIPIGIAESTHKLSLNGKLVAKCEDTKPVGLPPTQSVTAKLTMKLENPAELGALAAGGAASYDIATRIVVMDGEDEIVSKTSGSGSVDLSKLKP